MLHLQLGSKGARKRRLSRATGSNNDDALSLYLIHSVHRSNFNNL